MAFEDINNAVKAHLDSQINNLLEKIATDFNIRVETLKKKYLPKPKKSRAKKTTEDGAEPPKRGRKKKENKDELIEMEVYEYQGTQYLVDAESNVYTYDEEHPALIGERLINGEIKLING